MIIQQYQASCQFSSLDLLSRATLKSLKIHACLCYEAFCRLLIAEAEKAAKALEVAATKSPIARASLIETRKLIAEAVQLIESIESGQISSQENDKYPPSTPNEMSGQMEKETDDGMQVPGDADQKKVNGTKTLASNKEDDFGFGKFTLQDILNREDKLLPMNSSGYGLSPLSFESLIKQADSGDEHKKLGSNRDSEGEKNSPINSGDEDKKLGSNGDSEGEKNSRINGSMVGNPEEEETSHKVVTVTKRWVRGKLVEVAE